MSLSASSIIKLLRRPLLLHIFTKNELKGSVNAESDSWFEILIKPTDFDFEQQINLIVS